MSHSLKRQRGVVLMVTLVMLVVLTLLATSAINMSTASLRAVTNMQSRNVATSTAQRTIETVLSSNFTGGSSPDDIVAAVTALATDYTVTTQDNKSYKVTIAKPPCIRQYASVMNDELDPKKPTHDETCLKNNEFRNDKYIYCLSDEAKCRNDASDAAGASYCARAVWEVASSVRDGWFGANVDLTQGVRVMMWADLVSDTRLRCAG